MRRQVVTQQSPTLAKIKRASDEVTNRVKAGESQLTQLGVDLKAINDKIDAAKKVDADWQIRISENLKVNLVLTEINEEMTESNRLNGIALKEAQTNLEAVKLEAAEIKRKADEDAKRILDNARAVQLAAVNSYTDKQAEADRYVKNYDHLIKAIPKLEAKVAALKVDQATEFQAWNIVNTRLIGARRKLKELEDLTAEFETLQRSVAGLKGERDALVNEIATLTTNKKTATDEYDKAVARKGEVEKEMADKIEQARIVEERVEVKISRLERLSEEQKVDKYLKDNNIG